MDPVPLKDNHLAAFSNCHISLMDYSGGWSEDSQRKQSFVAAFAFERNK